MLTQRVFRGSDCKDTDKNEKLYYVLVALIILSQFKVKIKAINQKSNG